MCDFASRPTSHIEEDVLANHLRMHVLSNGQKQKKQKKQKKKKEVPESAWGHDAKMTLSRDESSFRIVVTTILPQPLFRVLANYFV